MKKCIKLFDIKYEKFEIDDEQEKQIMILF